MASAAAGALQVDAQFEWPGPADALPFCIRVNRVIRGHLSSSANLYLFVSIGV